MSQPNPATSPSELIAVGDLSIEQRRFARDSCDAALIQQAVRSGIRSDPSDLVIRDTLPSTDLGIQGTGTTNNEDWLIQVAFTIAVDALYINAVQVGINNAIAFYGLSTTGAAPLTTRVWFKIGSAGATPRAVFQPQQLQGRLEPTGYFSKPITYGRQDLVTVAVRPRASAAAFTEPLVLLARTVEQLGNFVGAPLTQ